MTGKHAFKLWGLAILGLVSANANALPFYEGFDTPPGSILNWEGDSAWLVTNGTVDLILSGEYGITCAGGSGGCVDLDGSTSNAGILRVRSAASFTLEANQQYRLTAEISGSQRDFPDTWDFNELNEIIFGFTTNSGAFSLGNTLGNASFISTGLLAFNAPFALYEVLFTPTSQIVGARLGFMSGAGQDDNIGAIVDNIRVAAVPLPAAAWLLLSGLGALGVMARRRRAVVAAA